jgi:frataxin-like iron-binding protein CyaY
MLLQGDTDNNSSGKYAYLLSQRCFYCALQIGLKWTTWKERILTLRRRYAHLRAVTFCCLPGMQDGVVKLAVPGKGTWVINTHGVTRQIWLSSPVRCAPRARIAALTQRKTLSGPNKYNFHSDRRIWLGERDQHSLHDKLQREFSAVAGFDVSFERRF